MRRGLAAAALAAMLALLAAYAAAQSVPEPQGYRGEPYKGATPATLQGARVVTTAEAEALWRAGDAVFIDVLPRPPKPDLPEGTVWQEPPHHSIAGSVWLADVGYDALSPEMEAWYRAELDKAAAGDKDRALLIYCRAECWMSWNAAKRAVEWGYTGVLWYPEGVDGWKAADLPLEETRPAPRPGEAS